MGGLSSAQSNVVIEENLIKGLSIKVWVGFRETQKRQYSNLGLATAITFPRPEGAKGQIVAVIQRG